MNHRIPIIPTAIVAIACITMVALGFWQLDRKGEKEALLARYAAAQGSESEVVFPADESEMEERLFRRSRVDCANVRAIAGRAGRSTEGVTGWAHVAECVQPDGSVVDVALGFSRRPQSPAWEGGTISGWIAPGPRLVAAEPVAGLAPLARPDPAAIPNNHLAYAGQWFFFALTALVIYVLALRRRRGGGPNEGSAA